MTLKHYHPERSEGSGSSRGAACLGTSQHDAVALLTPDRSIDSHSSRRTTPFARTASLFCLGLLISLKLVDVALGLRFEHGGNRKRFGVEVLEVVLDDALVSCPATEDVYLFVFPGVLANDLVPPFSHDYFCAYFNYPRQIVEVFHTKKDTKLASQIGRLVLPNLLAENSRHWIAAAPSRAASENIASAPDPEPLLHWCNKLLSAPPSPTRAPPNIT